MADVGTGNGDGAGRYLTFAGGGFGTVAIRVHKGEERTPPAASSRAYLRGGLPAIYQEQDFAMRFVESLETVLDPIIALLDCLPAHFDPDHAPSDLLKLMAAWLGIELVETQELSLQREMVRRAAELARRRGTAGGLRLALQLSFPDLPLRVQDSGGILFGDAPDPQPQRSSFVVLCDEPVSTDTQAAIAECIERYKPVHTTYRLRVKAG
jgi:phage tail-like protein